MSSVIKFLVSLGGLGEFDEVKAERTATGTKYKFLTTTLHPSLAEFKARVYAWTTFPPKKVDSIRTEVIQEGLIFKRVVVDMDTSPLFSRKGRLLRR